MDDDAEGTYQWHLRPGRGRLQHQGSLNPEAESFQAHQGSTPSEEDVPLQREEDASLQSEKVADVSQLAGQLELDPPASGVPESGELGEELSDDKNSPTQTQTATCCIEL